MHTASGINGMPPDQSKAWNVTGLRGHQREVDEA